MKRWSWSCAFALAGITHTWVHKLLNIFIVLLKKKNVQNISPGNLIMLILPHSLLGHRFAPGCQKWTCSHSDVSAIP